MAAFGVSTARSILYDIQYNNHSGFKLSFISRLDLLAFADMAANTYSKSSMNNELASFGYGSNRLRAKAFAHGTGVVVAFKGTSPIFMGIETGRTSKADKLIDKVLYSICSTHECEKQKLKDLERIGYLADALQIVQAVANMYPGMNLTLTGHSMGGTIASLAAAILNLPAIVFSSPGDAYIAKILGIEVEKSTNQSIIHVGMCNDAVFKGKCNRAYGPCGVFGYRIQTKCHLGTTFCIHSHGWNSVLYHPIDVIKSKLTSFEDIVLTNIHAKRCVYV
ncbi:putative lipase atg15 [Ordospora colligata]